MRPHGFAAGLVLVKFKEYHCEPLLLVCPSCLVPKPDIAGETAKLVEIEFVRVLGADRFLGCERNLFFANGNRLVA